MHSEREACGRKIPRATASPPQRHSDAIGTEAQRSAVDSTSIRGLKKGHPDTMGKIAKSQTKAAGKKATKTATKKAAGKAAKKAVKKPAKKATTKKNVRKGGRIGVPRPN
ncbi:hypothetical protein [Solimonas aquatica]|uniref:hypothetical protein n=1 Tax=Solimonas aquatica TaxID=489703 RepID=UPI0015A5585A|nr:hypothetical protein [Solimonas aquatica]